MQHHTTKIIERDEDVLVTKGFLIDRISEILLSPEQETGPEDYIQGLREIKEALSLDTVGMSAAELEALMALSLIAEKDHSLKIVETGAALELFRAWKNHLHTKGSLPPRARELKNQE
ncbi:hypothetical protein SLS60_009478 [Paraconiothyrium brasiliense]|uniref:Uncharacterized protein n=1 Tax=Paraconiothyrium brasiliense TaxID=300254 RepID=A0ABR3QUF4_9PLEO